MILTLTGASGAGKTTIAKGVLANLESVKMLTSYTTRQPRESDLPREYAYLTVEEFMKMKKADCFIWDVFVHGVHYGTTVQSLGDASKDPDTAHLMILTPDVLATLHYYAKTLNAKICSFYILSPPAEVLRARLQKRGDEPEVIERRLADCVKWDQIALFSSVPYVYVKNDGLPETAIEEVLSLVRLFRKLSPKIDP